jgi:predicted RecA/RadA family phage recombinase
MSDIDPAPVHEPLSRRGVIAGGVGLTAMLLPIAANAVSGGEASPSVTTTPAVPAGSTWTYRTAAESLSWNSVTYGNGTFVAVAGSGTGNRVMTSPNGITWSSRSSAADMLWGEVAYGTPSGQPLFVAVASSGTGDRVMTSPDGITWTSRSASDNTKQWNSVTWGDGEFVAVQSGSGNSLMASTDGVTWTTRSTGLSQNSWVSMAYGSGVGYVAVAQSGSIMSSADGITWSSRTAPPGGNQWTSVAYGTPGGQPLFVAVGNSTGTAGTRVATSSDGVTWSTATYDIVTYGGDDSWFAVAYGENSFVVVGGWGALVRNQSGTWTTYDVSKYQTWSSLSHGNGTFVAVASGGSGSRVMTSPDGT